MTRTVLVTGSSSGIGRASVDAFLDAGWNVVATMRTPDRHADLAARERVLLERLDVTEPDSVASALASGIERFGRIDCVVNNAGYGLVGPFEGADDAQVRQQFETNVFGVLEVCRQVLPHMREHRSGTIVNVTSMGGRLTFPLYSVYHATKWAVEGFSESLAYELRPFGIRVRVIEPGPIATDFYGRSMELTMRPELTEYQAYVDRAVASMNSSGDAGAPASRVARTIVRAASSGGWRLRWPADARGRQLLTMRRLLPERAFNAIVRRSVTGA